MKKTCNNKLLAASLMEWTLNSETTFIEAKDNKELIEIAKKFEIVIPSPDLALFKTIYAEIDKVNLNNVILPKKAVEEGLPTLRAKQVNWNHEGAHQIAGHILDAKIENNKIIIYGVLFKSLFREEFATVEKLFAEKKLFVSYEIYNRDESGNSVIHDLGNGIRSVSPIIFHGCGMLLLDENTGKPIPPACPNAMVTLLANKKVIEEAEQIIDKVFEKDSRLIYAELIAIEEQEPCTRCKTCTCFEKEDKNIMAEEIKIENGPNELIEDDYEGGEIEDAKKLTTEQRNALPDSDFALIQEKDGKKIRRFPINDEAHVRNALARLPQAKDISEEEKKSALAKILKKAKELNMTELLKKYEKAEEVIEEPKKEEIKIEEIKIEETQAAEVKPEEVVKTTPEETKVEAEVKPEVVAQVAETPVTEIKLVKEVVQESVITTYIPKEDGTGNTSERKGERKTTRYYSDGKEEVSTEEYTVVDTYSLAQLEEKVNIVKAEKDIEITNLKNELAAKAQEIVELTKPKVEIAKVEKPELDVGNVEKAKDDKYKKIHDEVNERAFGKKKDKK